jgi:GNAT superfamily N-acetyltransferase
MQYPAIRQLIDSDRWRLRPHFKALAPEDRHLRFGATLNDSAVDRYVDLIDFDTDAVLGVADRHENLLAVAHVAPVGEGAELGLSVHEAARGRGLGGALFEQAVSWARNRYLQRIYMHCLRENRAILHLARRHGMTISMDGTDSTAVLLLPAPDIETWVSEQATHWRAAAEELMRVEQNLFGWPLAGYQASGR